MSSGASVVASILVACSGGTQIADVVSRSIGEPLFAFAVEVQSWGLDGAVER